MVPQLEGKVYFHKGLFGNTITPFLEEKGDDAFLAYANIDCDLYTSTLDILVSSVYDLKLFERKSCAWYSQQDVMYLYDRNQCMVGSLKGRFLFLMNIFATHLGGKMNSVHGVNLVSDLGGNMNILDFL